MHKQIRLATATDADAILEIYAPIVQQTVISFEMEVPTLETMRERITTTTTQHPWLVVDMGGEIAGYAYASPHRTRAAYQWSVDVSAYVHAHYRQRRIGKALYTSLFRILKEQGYYNAYAGITLPNTASVALHESLGFLPIGVYTGVGFKQGAWHDVGWWHLRIRPPGPPPSPPLSVQALTSDPAWEALLNSGLSLIGAE